MKMFKGLTNEPETAFHHIAVLLEAGLIISASGDEECDELSNDIFFTGTTIRQKRMRCI
ncbi:hypothetical protein QTO45_20970 [Escherichia coli]|uniref:hypothetical protein n=1 Tax=Escherichia coli TaxID=562 RepID=UPI00259A78D8|nr:hypothetical protein [Escherichia coli]MDM4037807.1 hypothetical protein [Escherichia coli]